MRDLRCTECSAEREDLVRDDEVVTCTACGAPMEHVITPSHVFATIVPTYPGSKRMKAGYVHTHGDRPAEKGYVGGFGPGPRK